MRAWGSLLVVGLLLLTLGGPRAYAQGPNNEELPKFVLAGLDAYKAEGPEAAMRAWLKGSPLEGSKEALSQANILRQIQDFYGAYKAFDVIKSQNLSPRVRVVFLSLDYEKGPVFAKFVAYRSDQVWILTTVDFNTKAGAILPACP